MTTQRSFSRAFQKLHNNKLKDPNAHSNTSFKILTHRRDENMEMLALQ